MRFQENGPALPDELLVARDEGRVLFFCGAGVSQAGAHLPGFLGLAERVLSQLRALPDSPARKLVDVAAKLQEEPLEGVGGVIAADRIFGLLERDFALADIERAVGRALVHSTDVNLEPHRILLDLSRSPTGEVQLVTTNFDLLFEAVDPRLPVWTPSQLPDLRRDNHFSGIVHLHGMFDPTYSIPVGGNLVLSSAEFGRAYLAEGWATEFIRSAIARYLIVFVGYTADDPPVQYLLEALHRAANGQPNGLYAFQKGNPNQAEALWRQKGVTAIAYTSDDTHSPLWKTLKAWADRARDPDRWRTKLLRKAVAGPRSMEPHERGQVVHLASTAEGARCLAETKKPLPSEWLCVFDPRIRYGTPGRARFNLQPDVNPFERYSLDSDVVPAKRRESDAFKLREVPTDALDVLAPVPLDGDVTYSAGLHTGQSSGIAPLPDRLLSLASWFARVCGESSAIWWAAGQSGLHPVVMRNVSFELDRKNNLNPTAASAWRYLLEAWDDSRYRNFLNGYALKERIEQNGWTTANLRSFMDLHRKVLKAERPYSAVPPSSKRLTQLRDALHVSIEYADDDVHVTIPDTEIGKVLPLLRNNLQELSALEAEIDPYAFNLNHLPPIEPDPDLPGESSDRDRGFSARVLVFAELFGKFAVQDRDGAWREFSAWPRDDHPVFARLRVWAAGIPNLLDDQTAGEMLIGAADRVFWGTRDQRDVLLVLARRWNNLPSEHRGALEKRLRKGLPRGRRDNPKFYPIWRAQSIAERLGWLKLHGCKFNFDVDDTIKNATVIIPGWNPEKMAKAAASHEGRGGTVRIDPSFSSVADTPIERLVAAALTAREHPHGTLTECDPYSGLVQTYPVRVLAALMRISDTGDTLKLGWTHFIQASARRQDKPRFAALIAHRLVELSSEALAAFRSAAAYWIEVAAETVFKVDPRVLYALLDRLVTSIRVDPEEAHPRKLDTGEDRDWVQNSWNSVVGHLVAVLVADPSLASVKHNTTLPAVWVERAERLLGLDGDHGRYALTQFARHLNWFYWHDPDWAERNVIHAMEGDGATRDAALAGFFIEAKVDGEVLFNRLKKILMPLATAEVRPDQHRQRVLASLFISGWRLKNDSGGRFLSDDELRTIVVNGDGNLRSHMLWNVERWSIAEKLELLRGVWPLQLAARGAIESTRLASIAFSDEANFASLADAVTPFLSPIKGRDFLFSMTHGKDRLTERHPELVLGMLHKMLPERASEWPYSADALLLKLAKANPKLKRDSRFRELRLRRSRSR